MNLAAETLRLSNRFQASTINACFTKADYEIKEKDYRQETIMHERSTTIIDTLKE